MIVGGGMIEVPQTVRTCFKIASKRLGIAYKLHNPAVTGHQRPNLVAILVQEAAPSHTVARVRRVTRAASS